MEKGEEVRSIREIEKSSKTTNKFLSNSSILHRTSSSIKTSSSGDISFRDFTIGKSLPSVSLINVEETAYSNQERLPQLQSLNGSIPSLSSICIRIFSEKWPTLLRGIQPDHILSAKSLLNEIEKSSGNIPFKIFVTFSSRFGSQLPLKRRTNRSVVLDDIKEFSWINQLNTEGQEEWRKETAKNVANQNYAKRKGRPFIPAEIDSTTFFLSTVDFSNHTNFIDDHILKLKPISAFLAVLRLDFTQVTDVGINFIFRQMGDKEEYEKLEVLTLKGLKKVTDISSIKVSFLPSLRMLDLRLTSCTNAFGVALNQKSKQFKWKAASHRSKLDEHISVELELFGPSYSPSKILTLLRLLAAKQHSHPTSELLEKPITFQITSSSRTAPITSNEIQQPRTAEELYLAQIALSAAVNSKAAYNPTFGSITCTTKVSRGILDEDAVEERSRGPASRSNEHVASGKLVGGIENSGRNTLYSVGTRKLTINSDEKIEESQISDLGSDDEDQLNSIALITKERKEKQRRMQQESLPSFYQLPNLLPQRQQQQSNSTKKRVPIAAEVSDLMLLRHLPLKNLCEKAPSPPVILEPIKVSPVLEAGAQLKLKRKAVIEVSTVSPVKATSNYKYGFNSTSHSSSSPYSSSILPHSNSSSTLPRSSSSTFTPTPKPQSIPSSSPFAKKPRLNPTIAVSASKPLPARSKLAVFSRK